MALSAAPDWFCEDRNVSKTVGQFSLSYLGEKIDPEDYSKSDKESLGISIVFRFSSNWTRLALT